MTPSRRQFVARAGAAAVGLALLPVLVNGCTQNLTPEQARQAGAGFQSLTDDEVRLLERLGDVLLPGAARAGISHFVDHHVSVPSAQSLLLIRYLDVPPPYLDFYRAGLAALEAYARTTHHQGFADLPGSVANELVGAIARQPPAGWQGPPSPLLYLTVRSDAVDVVYGTVAGFQRLGVPYMPHLEPEHPW